MCNESFCLAAFIIVMLIVKLICKMKVGLNHLFVQFYILHHVFILKIED